MPKVKAKFVCESVHDFGTSKTVQLRAVTSGSEENKSFAKYTPSGSLQLSIDNGTDAGNLFVPRAEYYLFIQSVNDCSE